MWSTLWYTTWREIYEYAQIRWPVFLLGFSGIVVYLSCTFSRHNEALIKREIKKIYLVVFCCWIVAVLGIPKLWTFPDIRYFRPVKEEVFYSSYPIGVFIQGVKTLVSLSTRSSKVTIPDFDQTIYPGREIYIQIIGEAEQYYRWAEEVKKMNSSLLANRQVAIFHKNISQAVYTYLSVPMMLTGTDDLAQASQKPTWVQFAQQRGCRTGWLAANEFDQQNWYRSAVDFSYDLHEITENADRQMYDDMLLPEIRRILRQGTEKLCLVIHTGGSHVNYLQRYRPEQEKYKVDRKAFFNMRHPDHKFATHTAYHNTLVKNIQFLDAVIAELKKYDDARVLMIYAPDHGENLYDDGTKMATHGRSNPSRYELHVPLVVWASSELIRMQPEEWQAMIENQSEPVSNKYIFPTLLWAMGINHLKVSDAPPLFADKRILRISPRKITNSEGKKFQFEDHESQSSKQLSH